jgi:hypothetical protein
MLRTTYGNPSRGRSDTAHAEARTASCPSVGLAPVCVMVVALGLAAGLPAAAHAQVVRGAVTEAGTGRGVEGAIVRLINADSQQVAMLLTGSDGSFVLVAPRGGAHVLEVDHVQFEPLRTNAFNVPHDGATARLVRLVRRSAPPPTP